MSKVLAVFGATGRQGESVINFVLNDAQLSAEYRLRAITRDVNSEKATKLKDKIEVVYGDLTDRDSIKKALTGSHTILAITVPDFGPDGAGVEREQAKMMADVAIEVSAQYFIFSTLPSIAQISNGKYTKVTHFEEKAEAERYIRGLPIKSAFIALGTFMQNFHTFPFIAPIKKIDDNTYAITRHNPPDGLLPYVEALADTGKFVGAILADPAKYEGKVFCCASGFYSYPEVAEILSKVTGKHVEYRQVSPEEIASQLPFVPDLFMEALSYSDQFGFYGPQSKELVTWAIENARGKVTSLEEYFKANPLQLE